MTAFRDSARIFRIADIIGYIEVFCNFSNVCCCFTFESTTDAWSLRQLQLAQRFSIPVLAPHRSAHFVCYSYHFRRLFYSNASALRSGHHTIFLHDSSSKRTYSIHSALKCARREFKLYIFTDVYDDLCSANPLMNVLKWSKLQRISPAQGVGSNGHCVGSMSIGTQFIHGAHF